MLTHARSGCEPAGAARAAPASSPARNVWIQRSAHAAAAPSATSVPPVVDHALRSPGHPLDSAVRGIMEARFGHDFGQVRVHTGASAAMSARALQARAYTLGRDVVFGAGEYAPSSAAGQRLLAHELTHVVQQRRAVSGEAPGQGSRPEVRDEEEAERAAASVAGGADRVPAIGRSAPALRRQGASPTDEQRAGTADLLCDIPGLCRLRSTAPGVVTTERIRSVAQRCRPGTLLWADPCLMPQFVTPPASVVPGPTGTPTPGAGGGSGGLDLGDITTIRFNLGPVRLTAELPSSLKAQLPVALSSAHRLEFTLSGDTSGSFSFGMRLNGVPHVQISARAGVDLGAQRASAGLEVTTTRTVCRATEPETARSQLQSAGEGLRDAILALQTPPAPAPGTDQAAAARDRLVAVARAVHGVYSVVERVRRPCEQRPVMTFGISGRMPLGPESTQAPGVFGSATFHF